MIQSKNDNKGFWGFGVLGFWLVRAGFVDGQLPRPAVDGDRRDVDQTRGTLAREGDHAPGELDVDASVLALRHTMAVPHGRAMDDGVQGQRALLAFLEGEPLDRLLYACRRPA